MDEDLPPWGPASAPIAIVLGLAAAFAATIAVQLIGAAAGSSIAHPAPLVSLLASLSFDLGFVGAAIWVARTRGPIRPANFGFRRPAAGAIVVVAVAALGYYGISALYAGLLHLSGEKLPKELGFGSSTGALVAAGIFVCALAPVMEEFFFRGFLFGALRRLPLGRATVPVASVAVGILFALAHAGSAPARYLVPLGIFGVVLCLVRWRTRSLLPCIALHAFNNALALGVNQLHWGAGAVAALCVAALAAAALTVAPILRLPRASAA